MFLTFGAAHIFDRSGGALNWSGAGRAEALACAVWTMTDQAGEPDGRRCLKTDLLSAP